MLPAFYAVQGFGFDKPAHTACRHLTRERRCAIHPDLAARGFAGCMSFDCFGAGQRVTQALLAGGDWPASAAAADELARAYDACLALHRLMALLVTAQTASRFALDDRIRAQLARLDALCGSAAALAGELDLPALEKETLALAREALRLGRARPEQGAETEAPGLSSARTRAARAGCRS